jgi:FAD-linked sulfhydryl oxidase
MDPTVWGAPAWTLLFSIAFNYPNNPSKKEIHDHKKFFKNLRNILPCYNCRDNFRINLDKYPVADALTSKKKLIKWLIKIQNEIRVDNGQKALKSEEIVKYYDDMYDYDLDLPKL